MKMKLQIYSVFMTILTLMAILSASLFLNMWISDKSIFLEWELYTYNSTNILFLILLDWMSMMFIMTVSLISAVISGFSKYYMEHENMYKRFMITLMMFVCSMMMLVLSPNLISLLLGWDGLGLTSYVLIIFYQNENSCNSGMLTMLSNRVGDAMILICIALMFCNGSWNFMLETTKSSYMSMLMILSATTKSAQMPFSAWLPAAMAAPTPVSALVHSSTLVTAGVYLMIRFYPCMLNHQNLSYLMAMSAMTMVMSSWMANFEMDMKKIIALSTLSQLGFMMMIIAAGSPELAFFHLITHAMFKSTIFMCAGIMIHNLKESQDLRSSENLFLSGPLMGAYFTLTNLSLCGFPFLAGFFSKDLLLENILSRHTNLMYHVICMIGTALTLSYTIRVMYLLSNTHPLETLSTLKDMNMYLSKTMTIMYMMSMTSGLMLGWMIIPLSSTMLNLSSPYKYMINLTMIMTTFIMMAYMNTAFLTTKTKMTKMKKSLHLMFNLPFITAQILPTKILKQSNLIHKISDLGWLEFFVGLNLYKISKQTNYNLTFMQKSKFMKIFLYTAFTTMILFMMMI
uniref:NADH-ubiquinone oxidoreductase chain 5 n=1 Tax=Metacrangonyx dhofarensis TaxID=2291046 RepID=A0A345UDK4_9CRUS|nr:NADH dehydrogenase subunit 5 [Metacrangonyx dhofarensis]